MTTHTSPPATPHRITLGHTDPGDPVIWDTHTSPFVVLTGPEGAAREALTDRILDHTIQTPEWVAVVIDLEQTRTYGRGGLQVATDIDSALTTMRDTNAELERRYEALWAEQVADHTKHPDGWPNVLLLVDDARVLLVVPEARDLLTAITRKGRAAGIATLISTRASHLEVIDTEESFNLRGIIVVDADTPGTPPTGHATFGPRPTHVSQPTSFRPHDV